MSFGRSTGNAALIRPPFPFVRRPGRSASHSRRSSNRFTTGSRRTVPMRRANVWWMRGRRLIVGVTAGAGAAVLLLFGGLHSGPSRVNPLAVLQAYAAPASPDQVALSQLLQGFSTGDTA